MKTNLIDVVVLAGERNQRAQCKALLPFQGRASLHYVLEALEQVPEVRHVCVEGPLDLLVPELAARLATGAVVLVEGGGTLLDSLTLGLKHFSSASRVLFVTADLPLLTSEAISEFLQTSERIHADLSVSVVPRQCYTGAFKRYAKPSRRYRDTRVCNGGLFLASPDLLQQGRLRQRLQRAVTGHKAGLITRLALGWQIALVYLFGVELLPLLTLRQMAQFTSRQLGVQIRPIVMAHPELSIHADRYVGA